MITCPIFARRSPLWLGMDGWLGDDIHVQTRAAGVVVKRSSQAGGGHTQLKHDEPRNSLIGNGYQVTATTDWPWNWKIRIAIYRQSIRCCSASVRYRVVIRKQTTKYCTTILFRLQSKNMFIQKYWSEIPSKQKPLTQCRTNVGRWSNIGPTFGHVARTCCISLLKKLYSNMALPGFLLYYTEHISAKMIQNDLSTRGHQN